MTSSVPWSVKGINPETRETAKGLARRSGLSLGEWLNRIIAEEAVQGKKTGSSYSGEDLTDSVEAINAQEESERLGNFAHGAIDYKRQAAGAVKSDQVTPSEVVQIAASVEALTHRLENTETKSYAAIEQIAQAVKKALQKLSHAEQGSGLLNRRMEEIVRFIRAEQGKADLRFSTLEEDRAKRMSLLGNLHKSLETVQGKIESQKNLETLIGDLSAHLSRIESRTQDATEDLRRSLNLLDDRLGQSEALSHEVAQKIRIETDQFDDRLSDLHATLNQNIDSVKDDITKSFETLLSEAGYLTRFDAVEKAIERLADHVADIDKTSSEAIDQMSRDIMDIADNSNKLNVKLLTVEEKGNTIAKTLGDNMEKMAEVVDKRFADSQNSQTRVLKDFSAQITKISDRLSQRITNSEARTKAFLEQLSAHHEGFKKEIDQKTEDLSSLLTGRLKDSESRTTNYILEQIELKSKLNTELLKQHMPEQHVEGASSALHEGVAESDIKKSFRSKILKEEFIAPELTQPLDAFAAPPGWDDSQDSLPQPSLSASIEEAKTTPSLPKQDPKPSLAETDGKREMLSTSPGADLVGQPEGLDDFANLFENLDVWEQTPKETSKKSQTPDLRNLAKMAESEPLTSSQTKGGFFGFGPLSKSKKKSSDTNVPAVALVAVLCGTLGVATAGFVTMGSSGSGTGTRQPALIAANQNNTVVIRHDATAPPPLSSEPRQLSVATLTNPRELVQNVDAKHVDLNTDDPKALFDAASLALQTADPQGLSMLMKSANLGYPQAQFLLSTLYDKGLSGVSMDPNKARQWVERAANGGLPKAMYNFGCFLFKGIGGPQDPENAANWFHRAADLGVKDAQYNLAKLYETGFGVSQNLSEAYMWYLVATKNGDHDSKIAAEKLKPSLGVQAQRLAEQQAENFKIKASIANKSTQFADSRNPQR